MDPATLLGWYDARKRELPWRATRDPYAIWVSEVMLQQTQVKTVVPYFERWIQRFPGVRELADAAEDDVLHAWQGLGYYSRARSLQRAAREVVARFSGQLPRDPAALQTLPGIGPYSAGAIASIAFGERAPVVDGNVIRVLTRLFALRGDPARAPLKRELWRRAAALVPPNRPGDFNQALMELGATVCVPDTPRCAECPWSTRCEGRAAGIAAQLPELAQRPKPTAIEMAAAVVERRGRFLVVKSPADAKRWASMWQFPATELEPGEAAEAAALRAVRQTTTLRVKPASELTTIRHGVTRFLITLRVYRCVLAAPGPTRSSAEIGFYGAGELEALAMPAAHRRVARLVARRAR